MKFLPNFEGFRRTPFYAPIFLTKDVLYPKKRKYSKKIKTTEKTQYLVLFRRFFIIFPQFIKKW